jgi:hypothetical protein
MNFPLDSQLDILDTKYWLGVVRCVHCSSKDIRQSRRLPALISLAMFLLIRVGCKYT